MLEGDEAGTEIAGLMKQRKVTAESNMASYNSR